MALCFKASKLPSSRVTLLTIRKEGVDLDDSIEELAEIYTPKQFMDIPVEFLFQEGDLTRSILKEEQANDYDLIILGTKRREGIRELLFGNVTENLIDKQQVG